MWNRAPALALRNGLQRTVACDSVGLGDEWTTFLQRGQLVKNPVTDDP
jgi:hypothetical protein